MKQFGGSFSFLSSTPREDMMCRLERELEDVGYAVLAFIPDDGRRFAAFSIGLTTYGHPELFVTGAAEDSVRTFLQHLIEQVLYSGKTFRTGTTSTSFYSSLEVLELPGPTREMFFYDELLGDEDVRILCVRQASNDQVASSLDALAS